METKNNTVKYRVEQLEKGYDKLDTKMDAILTNHLPHLNNELEKLKTRVTVTAIINVGAIITGLLISKIIL